MVGVTFEGVSKRYPGGVLAVQDLNLRVKPGEHIVLLGPSGCGKTTTLRLLAGLEEPTSGTILLGDRSAKGMSPRERNVGFVFQRPALYPHLTVRDNLAFGWRMRHRSGWLPSWLGTRHEPTELSSAIDEAARFLRLQDLLHRYPGQLSGGQQQRVALGRVLVRRPAILLLDEPFSSLDGPLRVEMRRELHLLMERFPVTMLHVTHDPAEAAALADRIVVLREGVLQQADTPERLYREPCNRFVAGYVGWPPMNFLEGQLLLQKDGPGIMVGAEFLLLPASWQGRVFADGAAVTLGIRPESLHLEPIPTECGELRVQPAGTELLGDHGLASFRCGESLLTVLIPSCTIDRSGEAADFGAHRNCKVYMDMTRIHLFDRTTGKALSAASSCRPNG